MKLKSFIAIVCICFADGHAVAGVWPSTFDEEFKSVEKQGCKKGEQSDFIFFLCEREPAQYYFTKPNTPAYPGVLKRYFKIENGMTYLATDAYSWGDDAAQPAFEAWMHRLGSDPKELR
jgi:hypothetical protein